MFHQSFVFVLFRPREWVIAVDRINYSIILLCFNWKIGKFENAQIFKHYKILAMSSKKERNHYYLKEMENIKNAKMVWIAWRHNVLIEMFSKHQKNQLFCTKKSFFWPAPNQPTNFLQIYSAWYNLKSHGRLFL